MSDTENRDRIEKAGQELRTAIDHLLIDALKLSEVEHPDIFRGRDTIVREYRLLVEDHGYESARAERKRVLEEIAKVVRL